MLTTNRNLLIVADVLVVHRGLAEQNPQIVAGLVHGLLEGNRMVRDRQPEYLDVVGRAFKWTPRRDQEELASVHLSNLPENLAFFSGEIDEAGSFGGIYQSAVYAYGSSLIKDPVDSEKFVDLKHLQAIDKAGIFKDQKIAIAPIRTAPPARSKPIRCSARTSGSSSRRTRRRSIMANQDNMHEPRSDQEAAPGQPGFDAAPARPRRQRAGAERSASRAAKRTSARRRCAPWS